MKIVLLILANLAPFSFCLIGGKDDIRYFYHYFVVSIQDNNKKAHICGGAIYADRFILTAATCVTGRKTNDIHILAGAEKNDIEGIRYNVDEIIKHSEPAGKNGILNDIAILRLTENIRESDAVKSIHLPKNKDEEDRGGFRGNFFGWGVSRDYEGNSPNMNSLQHAAFRIRGLYKCRGQNPDVTITNICTRERGEGLCEIDAGGPLVRYDGRDTDNILWGIATSNQTCTKNDANIFTRVSSYKKWIEDVTNSGHVAFGSSTTFRLIIFAITVSVFNLIR